MEKALRTLGVFGATCVALVACTSSAADPGVSAAPQTLIIASSLPLKGPEAANSLATNAMITLYLDSLGNAVGDYRIEFKEYDTSSTADGEPDETTCDQLARAQAADIRLVAVMGTHDDGCDMIVAPQFNVAPDGPMLMVSDANTYPGMTQPWQPGEPEKYFPSGQRNFARVVSPADRQGAAMAAFAADELGLKKCYVLNDDQTFGKGVALSFVDAARANGIEVLGSDPWSAKQPSYRALFEQVLAKEPDCVILSGSYTVNGRQLLKDKVSVVGDNETVKVIATDAFLDNADFLKQPESEGVYVTRPGLNLDALVDPSAAVTELLAEYEAQYGALPPSSDALYGTAAVQVILAAIEKSDGTRESVNAAVFSGRGVSIPVEESAIGKEFSIDPATGDIDAQDFSVFRVQDGIATFVTAVDVG